LIEMLNAMRMGEITNAIEQKFYALARPVRYDDGIEPMELYPTKNEVKQSNERRLRDLGSKAHKYVAKDNTNSGGDPELTQQRIAMLDNTFLVEKELVLSVGAQVMYLINDPNEGLVNGSRGKIVTFCSTESWRKLVLQDSKYGVIDMYKQAFDKDEVEYGLMFQEQLDTLKVNNISVYNNLRTALHGPDEKLPVVDFGDGNPRLIEYHDFTVDDPRTDRAMAVRNQIPLILSWALSIHKAQGQTIPRLRVNLQKSFEFGQAYVAVSRAVSRDQLQILNFRRAAVMADPKVKQFYKSLQTL
jgi:ATP-dependent DNA helicase PIF1